MLNQIMGWLFVVLGAIWLVVHLIIEWPYSKKSQDLVYLISIFSTIGIGVFLLFETYLLVLLCALVFLGGVVIKLGNILIKKHS